MYKMIFAFLLLSLSPISLGLADDVQQVITLKDGSQIKGVLAGISDGVYTVKTPIIGDVHVAATDVASITNSNAMAALPATVAAPSPAASTPNSTDQQIASTQQRLMSDPQSMALIQQMAQDPEIAQALQDPALVQAVANHDLQAVQGNPAAQKLMSNPQMMALVQKLAAQQQQQQQGSSSP